LAIEYCEAQFRVFYGAAHIFDAAFVVDCQLLAGMHFILRICHHFLPNLRGAFILAAPFSHKRQFTLSLGLDISWQPD